MCAAHHWIRVSEIITILNFSNCALIVGALCGVRDIRCNANQHTKYDIIVETPIDCRLRAAHFRSPVAGTSKLILRVSHDVVRWMEFGVFLTAHGLLHTHTHPRISHIYRFEWDESAHDIETASATHWHALHVLVRLYCSEESLKYMVEKMEMITGCHAVGSQRSRKKHSEFFAGDAVCVAANCELFY